jgi:hypothetical protein
MSAGSGTSPLIKSIAKPHPIWSGIVAGQFGGLVMAVALMLIFALFMGTNALYPVQVIGSAFAGSTALDGFNLGAVIIGVVIHFVGPSLFWGFIFGVLAKSLSITTYKTSLLVGLLVGAVAMVDSYYLVPRFMAFMQGEDYWNREIPLVWDWVSHLCYGASFVLYPKFALWLGRKHDMVAKETRAPLHAG